MLLLNNHIKLINHKDKFCNHKRPNLHNFYSKTSVTSSNNRLSEVAKLQCQFKKSLMKVINILLQKDPKICMSIPARQQAYS